ncbi:hypothetical protein T484DRAFT_1763682 [Baffinella frigidus]|nr:hypothetical protein T484DRAFT_1763682 [Cryptophyta sp. CCMP2293]
MADSGAGSVLALGCGGGLIKIVHPLGEGEPRLDVKGHSGSVSCVALSGQGHLASTSFDCSVKLWDTNTQTTLCSQEIAEEMDELELEEGEGGPANLRGHTSAHTSAVRHATIKLGGSRADFSPTSFLISIRDAFSNLRGQ